MRGRKKTAPPLSAGGQTHDGSGQKIIDFRVTFEANLMLTFEANLMPPRAPDLPTCSARAALLRSLTVSYIKDRGARRCRKELKSGSA